MLNTFGSVPPPGCCAGSKAWRDWEATSMPQYEKEVSIKAGNSTAFPQHWCRDHSHAGIRAKFCYLSLNCPFQVQQAAQNSQTPAWEEGVAYCNRVCWKSVTS